MSNYIKTGHVPFLAALLARLGIDHPDIPYILEKEEEKMSTKTASLIEAYEIGYDLFMEKVAGPISSRAIEAGVGGLAGAGLGAGAGAIADDDPQSIGYGAATGAILGAGAGIGIPHVMRNREVDRMLAPYLNPIARAEKSISGNLNRDMSKGLPKVQKAREDALRFRGEALAKDTDSGLLDRLARRWYEMRSERSANKADKIMESLKGKSDAANNVFARSDDYVRRSLDAAREKPYMGGIDDAREVIEKGW